MAMKAPTIAGPTSLAFIEDLERIVLGHTELQVLYLPGHTPGSCALLTEDLVFVGDLLLPHATEASGLPGYDRELLDASVERLLAAVSGKIVAYPGHGRPRPLADLVAAVY
jgi:glyoxylase-like metal-dependent hydrolase (beta-lactamase superfamily II)